MFGPQSSAGKFRRATDAKKAATAAYDFFESLNRKEGDEEILKHVISGVATLGDPFFLMHYTTHMATSEEMQTAFFDAYKKLRAEFDDLGSVSKAERKAFTAILGSMTICVQMAAAVGDVFANNAKARREMILHSRAFTDDLNKAKTMDEANRVIYEYRTDAHMKNFEKADITKVLPSGTAEKMTQAMMNHVPFVRMAAAKMPSDVFSSGFGDRPSAADMTPAQRAQILGRPQAEQARPAAPRSANVQPKRSGRTPSGIRRRGAPQTSGEGDDDDDDEDIAHITIEAFVTDLATRYSDAMVAKQSEMNTIQDKIGNVSQEIFKHGEQMTPQERSVYFTVAANTLFSMAVLLAYSSGALGFIILLGVFHQDLALFLFDTLPAAFKATRAYWSGLDEDEDEPPTQEQAVVQGQPQEGEKAWYEKKKWRAGAMLGGTLISTGSTFMITKALPAIVARVGEVRDPEVSPYLATVTDIGDDPYFAMRGVAATLGLVTSMSSAGAIRKFGQETAGALGDAVSRSRTAVDGGLALLSCGAAYASYAAVGTGPLGVPVAMGSSAFGAICGHLYNIRQERRRRLATFLRQSGGMATMGYLLSQFWNIASYSKAASEDGKQTAGWWAALAGASGSATPSPAAGDQTVVDTDYWLFFWIAGAMVLQQVGVTIAVSGAYALANDAVPLARALVVLSRAAVQKAWMRFAEREMVRDIVGDPEVVRSFTDAIASMGEDVREAARTGLSEKVDAMFEDENAPDFLDVTKRQNAIKDLEKEIRRDRRQLNKLEQGSVAALELEAAIEARKGDIRKKHLYLMALSGARDTITQAFRGGNYTRVKEIMYDNVKRQVDQRGQKMLLGGGQGISLTGSSGSPQQRGGNRPFFSREKTLQLEI